MNAILRLDGIELWHLAGWTMLHFLWLGTLAGLAAGVGRLVLRRAPANARYGAALVCLAVLAALPVAIAAWVAAKPQVADRPGRAVRPQAVAGQSGVAPVIDLAVDKVPIAVPDATTTAVVPSTSTNAAPASSGPLPLAVFAIDSAARYLPWLWLLGTPLTFLLLATGVVGAERLRRASHIIDDGPIADACARLVESLRIGRRITVAVCERIAAPVLVGIIRPIILLPPAALTGWSPDEIEMVLLHELAHVRRWDNLVNLAQRFLESLLFFHPAVWLVSSWVRREREACCDAVVVGRTNRPHAYAEMLVALAAQLSEPSEPSEQSEPGRPRPRFFRPRKFSLRGRGLRRAQPSGRPGSLISSAMAAGPLRLRIRRILQLEDDPMLVSGKSLAVVMSGLLLAATLVVLNLPARGQAEESHAKVAENAEKAAIAPIGTATKASNNKFPSLEDQKLADLAWKRLGWELKPIQEVDRKRVQALGYESGVFVLDTSETGGLVRPFDILVGLHVWPTANLRDVANVLNREDIASLSPLMFYVVKPARITSPEGKSREQDTVITGRISVNVDAAVRGYGRGGYSMRPGVEMTGKPPAATDKPTLRYDGKTFDQWWIAWKTELSTEKRLEAVKALAAFGANGYGKETAEAILDIVEQLDWSSIDDSSAGKLKTACIEALTSGRTTGGYRVPTADWLPLVTEKLKDGSKSVDLFGESVFGAIPTGDTSFVPQLIALSRQESSRNLAFLGL
jgi:hypothetical protein